MKLVKMLFGVFAAVFVLFFAFVLWASSESGLAGEINGVRAAADAADNLPGRNLDGKIVIATYNVGYFSHLSNTGLVLGEHADSSFQEFDKRPSRKVFEEAEEAFQKAMNGRELDVLAAQEVDFKAYRSHHVNQGKKITSLLSFPYSAYLLTWDETFVPYPFSFAYATRGVVSGQGVFSRYPIVSQETVNLPQAGGFFRQQFDFKKEIQIAGIEIDGRTVYVMHVHIDAFDAETNFRQGEILFDAYRRIRERGPTIVLGDFNNNIKTENGENALSIFLESEDVAHVSQEPLGKDLYTYPSNDPEVPVDHILYDPNHFSVESWEVLNVSGVSDHLPVIATLNFIN